MRFVGGFNPFLIFINLVALIFSLTDVIVKSKNRTLCDSYRSAQALWQKRNNQSGVQNPLKKNGKLTNKSGNYAKQNEKINDNFRSNFICLIN
jgi:hypothetical protein